jgi:hypothetical protein
MVAPALFQGINLMYELVISAGAELLVVALVPLAIMEVAIFVRSRRAGRWWRSGGVASALSLILSQAMCGSTIMAMNGLFKAHMPLLEAAALPIVVAGAASIAGWMLLRVRQRLARTEETIAVPPTFAPA